MTGRTRSCAPDTNRCSCACQGAGRDGRTRQRWQTTCWHSGRSQVHLKSVTRRDTRASGETHGRSAAVERGMKPRCGTRTAVPNRQQSLQVSEAASARRPIGVRTVHQMREVGEPVVPRIDAFAQVRRYVVASRPVRRILCRRLLRTAGGGHPSRPAVARRLQRPTRGCLRTGRPPPAWPCSRWGLPSHPGRPGCWCALTAPFHPYLCGAAPETGPAIGGLFSVALSCGSPRLGVTQHRARWSPDVPRTGAP